MSTGLVKAAAAAILGNRIKEELLAHDLTQEEYAALVGLSYRHTNRITLAAVEPTLLQAATLAAVLRVPIDELFQVQVRTERVSAAALRRLRARLRRKNLRQRSAHARHRRRP